MQYTGGGLPGPQTSREFELRRVRRSAQGVRYLAGGAIINASLSRDTGNTGYVHALRPGLLMGKITATGLWRPSIIGVSTAAYVDNDTTITVDAATATEVARLITVAGASVSLKFVGPATDAAAGAIVTTSITATAATGTTITCGDLNVAKVSGSWIMPADGSETPLGLIDDGDPIRVTDVDGANVNQPMPRLLLAGELDSSQIINWPASTSTTRIAQIKSWLNNASNYGFTFDDAFEL